MTITHDQALHVLNMLSAAYPAAHYPDDTVRLYVSLMAEQFDDVGVLTAAAVRWVESETWPPNIAQLGESYQAEVARRLADVRAAEQQRAIAGGHGSRPAVDPGYAVEMIDVIRTALDLPPAVHRHGPGDVCPTCSRMDEIAATVTERARQLAADRRLSPPQFVETYSCPVCCDLGWVETSKPGGAVRPCRCRPAAYERWIDGHLMPGHDCGECQDVRRGGR